jgi:hypothetical protein
MPPNTQTDKRRDRDIGEAVANVFAAWRDGRENFAAREYENPYLHVEAPSDGYHLYGPDDCILARQPGPSAVPDRRPVLLNDRAYREPSSAYHVRQHVRHLLVVLGMAFEPVKPVTPHGPYVVSSTDLIAWWGQIRAVRELFDYAAMARTLVAAWLAGEEADQSNGPLNRAWARGDIISGTGRTLVCRAPGRTVALVLDARLRRGSHNARLRAALETELERKRMPMMRVAISRHDLRDDQDHMIEAWQARRRALRIEKP